MRPLRSIRSSAPLYTNRGNTWSRKGAHDKAIADFDVAIRLVPGDAVAHYNRGIARYSHKEFDGAIADYSEALRLAPGMALTYFARGLAWREKKEYDRAIADYNESIRLDSDEPAPIKDALALFLARRDGVVDGAKTVLKLEGWRGDRSIYAVLLGHFAAHSAGRHEQARTFLDEAAARCDTASWPYPIVKSLRRRDRRGEAVRLRRRRSRQACTEAHCFLVSRSRSGKAASQYAESRAGHNITIVSIV